MLNLNSIKEAQKRLKGIVHHTPFSYAPILSELSGYEVYLKKENLQRTGAFKLRGAFNKIATLVEVGKKGGVVAASAEIMHRELLFQQNILELKQPLSCLSLLHSIKFKELKSLEPMLFYTEPIMMKPMPMPLSIPKRMV